MKRNSLKLKNSSLFCIFVQNQTNMKKVLLVAAPLSFGYIGMAQEKYVVSANVALSKQSYDEAKENIDKAMASPESKDKPKTLFVKAQVYMSLQGVDKYKASNPYREGLQTALKLVEVKPADWT